MRPITKNRKDAVYCNISFNRETAEMLDEYCVNNMISRSDCVDELVRQALERKMRKAAENEEE